MCHMENPRRGGRRRDFGQKRGDGHVLRGLSGRRYSRIEEDRALIGRAVHWHDHRVRAVKSIEVVIGQGGDFGDGERHGRASIAGIARLAMKKGGLWKR